MNNRFEFPVAWAGSKTYQDSLSGVLSILSGDSSEIGNALIRHLSSHLPDPNGVHSMSDYDEDVPAELGIGALWEFIGRFDRDDLRGILAPAWIYLQSGIRVAYHDGEIVDQVTDSTISGENIPRLKTRPTTEREWEGLIPARTFFHPDAEYTLAGVFLPPNLDLGNPYGYLKMSIPNPYHPSAPSPRAVAWRLLEPLEYQSAEWFQELFISAVTGSDSRDG